MYLDNRSGVQGNTSKREFPRAQPEGTLEIKRWYSPVLPDLSQGTDIIQFLKMPIQIVLASTIPRRNETS